MEIRFEIDPDDGEVLAAYVHLVDGKAFRTVEIAEGECYVDEDENGRLLGVELLCPVALHLLEEVLPNRYKVPSMSRAISSLRQVMAAA